MSRLHQSNVITTISVSDLPAVVPPPGAVVGAAVGETVVGATVVGALNIG